MPNGIQGQEVMRRISLWIGTVLLLSSLPVAVSASEVDEYWSAPVTTTADQIGVVFDDRVDYFYIGALTGAVDNSGLKSIVCSSLTDEKCAKAEYFSFKAMLKPCVDATETNCVLSLAALKRDGSKIEGKFSRYVTTDAKTYWDGSSAAGVPDSRAESLWTFDGITHVAGSEFMLSSILDGTYKPGVAPRFNRLQSVVQPVSEVKDLTVERVRAIDTSLSFLSQRERDNQAGWTGGQKGAPAKNCAASDDGVCFKREPFPTDLSFSVTIKLGQNIGGWIHGRMKSPEITIDKSGANYLVKVLGEPIAVPVAAYWGNKAELSNEITSAYAPRAATTFGVGGGGTSLRYQTNGQFNQEQIRLFSLWVPLIKDQASANPKMWMFGSLSPDSLATAVQGLASAKECVTKASGLAGLVTTNATIYDGSIPAFDSAEGALNYQVAAPHYAADGTEFSGTYDLIMSSSVARCIYNFTSAPISASVSITSSDGGVQKVATTVLNERNGWLHLGAYGFGFSSPTLKVKLTQAKPAVVAKKTTITCVKGKTTKKVTAVGPKCPSGFKKKS
jgi:hypothetical protein